MIFDDAMIMKLPISEFLWEDMVAQKIDKYPYLEFILEGLKSRTRLLRNTTLPTSLYSCGEKKSFDKNSIF